MVRVRVTLGYTMALCLVLATPSKHWLCLITMLFHYVTVMYMCVHMCGEG